MKRTRLIRREDGSRVRMTLALRIIGESVVWRFDCEQAMAGERRFSKCFSKEEMAKPSHEVAMLACDRRIVTVSEIRCFVDYVTRIIAGRLIWMAELFDDCRNKLNEQNK